jgi:putative flippase GtrA
VTADADGQHLASDILRVAERLRTNPEALILGARQFDSRVPWRSRIGNTVTRILLHLVVGQKLTDTQTGLRGIPAKLIPHLLPISSQRYEFELDILIACRHLSWPVLEEPIQTIYVDGNRSSHFQPIADSMRIYFLLFRFGLLSVLTAVLDNVIFVIAFSSTGSIVRSQATSRLFAMTFNYLGARRLVFHSHQKHTAVLPKYVLLVMVNGLLSYGLILAIHSRLGVPAILAKLCAEGLLFAANFVFQRDFVFTRKKASGSMTGSSATDWTRYYETVPATAKLTRRYTTAVLLKAIQGHASSAGGDGRLSIVEIGGANSCFLDRILAEVDCRSYDVVDTNEYGLALLAPRLNGNGVLRLNHQSVLALSLDARADLVFSVGLVEHFNPSETRQAIHAHFDVLRPGGIAIISFPTPTLLYRITRKVIEFMGMWKFHDERPLASEEVTRSVRERGDVIKTKTLWPLLLTQGLIVAKKR